MRDVLEDRARLLDDHVGVDRVVVEDLGGVAHARCVVTTGSACAPIAAMVATSPAMPPAPLASLALKLITQAGARLLLQRPRRWRRWRVVGGDSAVMDAVRAALSGEADDVAANL